MSTFCASKGWHVRLGCGTKYSHHALPSQLSNIVKHVIYLATTGNFPLSLKLGLKGIVLMADWAISRVWSLDCRSISFGLSLATGCNTLGKKLQLGAKYMCDENWEIIEENTWIERKKKTRAWMHVWQKREEREWIDEEVLLGINLHPCVCIILDGFEYA